MEKVLFCVGASFVGVIASVTPEMSVDLWAQWGLAGVVVALVLWRDWQREKRMSTSIEKQEKWIRETLLEALNRNTEAVDRCYHMQPLLDDDEPGQ